MMTLTELPAELLVAILNGVDGKTVCRFQQVCRAFLNLVQGSVYLQLHIELAAAGLVKNDPDPNAEELTLREQLLRVRRYRKAWRDLDFLPPRKFDYTRARSYDGRIGSFHRSGVFILQLWPGDFECVQLSTPLGAQEERKWVIPAQKLPPTDLVISFDMDPSQDLLVIVSAPRERHPEQSVLLKSLRTGDPHTLAASPTVTIQHPSWITVSEMNIYHHLILFLYHDNTLWHISIYNWRTGNQVFGLQLARKHSRKYPKLSMMGNYLLFMTSVSVTVYQVERESGQDAPTPTCVLLLPAAPRGDKVLAVDIHPSNSYPHGSFCRFDPDQEIALLSMFYCTTMESRGLYITLPRAALVDIAGRWSKTDSPPRLEWDAWGPHTSMGYWDGRPFFPSSPVGQRAVLAWIRPPIQPPDKPPWTVDIQLLEFGAAAAAPGRSPAEATSSPGGAAVELPLDQAACTLPEGHLELMRSIPPSAYPSRTRRTSAKPSLSLHNVRLACVWENGVVIHAGSQEIIVLCLRG